MSVSPSSPPTDEQKPLKLMYKNFSHLTPKNWQDLEVIWNYLCLETPLPARADIAILGGSGEFTDMATRASELYHDGVMPLILVSGNENKFTTGNISEATLLAHTLEENGVPAGNIWLERHAATTNENIINSIKLLENKNFTPNNIILVHKPFVTRRFLATAEAFWPTPQPKFFVTYEKTTFASYRELNKQILGNENIFAEYLLGELERVQLYPGFGFTKPQIIPASVALAQQELARFGLRAQPLDPTPTPHST
ncbi:YdcF family protein [Candidatus Saccharibacteria bacterium]|nr:YdcF family protein [Candidatus Saccharibacteria bacterium]